MNAAVLSSSSVRPLPAQPTRDQVCAVSYSFNSLWVNLPTYGRFPWAENVAWLTNPADRQAAYAAKRANGDTHAIMGVTGRYSEPDAPYFNRPEFGQDFTTSPQRLQEFRDRCREVVEQGFYLDLRLGGDGQSNAQQTYNDPVGWTYGHQWLMANFERIFVALHELNDYIVWVPGFDGIFYGWDPQQVVAFGALARRMGVKHLGLEFNTGHIPLGEGPDVRDAYAPGHAMQDYDVLFGEFDPFNYHTDSTWQIVGRLNRPYNRPADQPAGDDPNPPFLLGQPNARGRWFFIAMEVLTYLHVRGRLSADDYRAYYDYYTTMGCEFVCK